MPTPDEGKVCQKMLETFKYSELDYSPVSLTVPRIEPYMQSKARYSPIADINEFSVNPRINPEEFKLPELGQSKLEEATDFKWNLCYRDIETKLKEQLAVWTDGKENLNILQTHQDWIVNEGLDILNNVCEDVKFIEHKALDNSDILPQNPPTGFYYNQEGQCFFDQQGKLPVLKRTTNINNRQMMLYASVLERIRLALQYTFEPKSIGSWYEDHNHHQRNLRDLLADAKQCPKIENKVRKLVGRFLIDGQYISSLSSPEEIHPGTVIDWESNVFRGDSSDHIQIDLYEKRADRTDLIDYIERYCFQREQIRWTWNKLTFQNDQQTLSQLEKILKQADALYPLIVKPTSASSSSDVSKTTQYLFDGAYYWSENPNVHFRVYTIEYDKNNSETKENLKASLAKANIILERLRVAINFELNPHEGKLCYFRGQPYDKKAHVANLKALAQDAKSIYGAAWCPELKPFAIAVLSITALLAVSAGLLALPIYAHGASLLPELLKWLNPVSPAALASIPVGLASLGGLMFFAGSDSGMASQVKAFVANREGAAEAEKPKMVV